MNETLHPDRGLAVETAQNVRDLGGYSTADGSKTKWGRFVRSGDMDQLSPEDQQRLIDYGVDAVIDLRMQREVRDMPNVFEESDQVRFYNHDFWGDRFIDYRSTRRGAPPEVKLSDLYCSGLEKSGFVMKEIFTTIAETEHSTFAFHCRSGKDRTGLVAALLLSIAGVSRETICADYALTARFLVTNNAKRVQPDQPGYYLTGCEPETMQLTLEFLDRDFGGAADYLNAVGLTRSQLDRIRSRMLD